MTVLVGVYCRDGIVVGADSAAVSAHGQTPLIMQQATKIDIVGDRTVLATTGALGLGQRFRHHVEEEWREKGFQGSEHALSTSLCRRTLRDFESTGVRFGNQGLGFGALLAAPLDGRQSLIEFGTTDFQPEIKSEQIMFVSMGSGQVLADPFLGFIRRVFWKNEAPRLQEGIFGALWALVHTIDLVPGTVSEPIQMAVLAREQKGQWRARKLVDDELGEHREHCKVLEERIGPSTAKPAMEAGTETAPPAPKPPKNDD